MMATERLWRMTRLGLEPVASKRCKLATKSSGHRQSVASKLRLNWAPGAEKPLAQKNSIIQRLETSGVPRDDLSQSICSSLRECLRKSCFAIFDRSVRSDDRNRRVSIAMDEDKSRIPSQSVMTGSG